MNAQEKARLLEQQAKTSGVDAALLNRFRQMKQQAGVDREGRVSCCSCDDSAYPSMKPEQYAVVSQPR